MDAWATMIQFSGLQKVPKEMSLRDHMQDPTDRLGPFLRQATRTVLLKLANLE